MLSKQVKYGNAYCCSYISILSNFSERRYLATASPEGPAPIIAILLTCNEADCSGSDPISSESSRMGDLEIFGSLLVSAFNSD